MHVVQSPGVGSVTAHWRGLVEIGTFRSTVIWFRAVEIRIDAAERVAEGCRRCRARAAGVFPLRLGGQGVYIISLQSIRVAFQVVQLAAELFRIGMLTKYIG